MEIDVFCQDNREGSKLNFATCLFNVNLLLKRSQSSRENADKIKSHLKRVIGQLPLYVFADEPGDEEE